jgi:hypothetical protein
MIVSRRTFWPADLPVQPPTKFDLIGDLIASPYFQFHHVDADPARRPPVAVPRSLRRSKDAPTDALSRRPVGRALYQGADREVAAGLVTRTLSIC